VTRARPARDDRNVETTRLTLPAGCSLRPLTTHEDERGSFTELFRREWDTGADPVQWNVVASAAGVLRGVHVHIRHHDYLTVPRGHATVGLRDLRRSSPTSGLSTLIDLRGDELCALTIPRGVAHGFLFHEPSLHVYAVSHYWDPEDELACHWADPELELTWPLAPTLVSPRDEAAEPLSALVDRLEPWQPL
jgi:dTDP-4-dehydrorhamnose 3,5-epimerase